MQEVYKAFAESKEYGFRDQIQGAVVSIMSNIAEGFDRGTNKEFIQFYKWLHPLSQSDGTEKIMLK